MIKKLVLAVFMAFSLDAYSETSIKEWLLTLKASSEQAASHINTAWKHLTSDEKIRIGNSVTNNQDSVVFGDINISGTTIKMNQEAEYWNPIIFPSLSILGTASISNLIINNSISDQLWGNTRISFDNQKGLVFSTSENQGEAIERTRIDLNGNISVSNNLFVRGYGQAGGIILSNGTIGLPVSGSTLTREGQLGWDSVWQTPSIKLNSNVTGQVFLEDFIFVTNVTDISIPDGAAVYAVGIEGKFRCVYLATSTNPICRIATKGLATEHILPHGSGHVTVRGDVNHINTSSFISNDAVYLSVVPGVLTSVLPQFPEDQISMGTVDIVSETEGRIGVNIRAVDRKEENLVGTLYSYNSKLSDINGYHLLSNEFENVEGYTTYTTNGITNGQTIISYLSPISRVTALAGGVSATIRLYATVSKDGNNLGGLIARLSAYTTNMTLLASYTSEYLLLDQNEIKRDIRVSILSNQTFTVPIRFSLDLIAQHTSDFRTYSVFAEDGRPLRVEVPLPSGQFAFRSDLDNYVTIPAWQYTNSIKLDITDGVATNLTIIKPLIIKGIDHSNQDLFFPQSNGVQVIGDPDQDLFYGLGGSIGKPAWWMQTYRNENPSSLHSPEFLYISNARIKKDIMVISEGGRVSINKNSNILDYHSDYQGYQTGNLNDLNFSGVYTYSKQRKYNVYISSVGNPDRWSWRKSYNNGLTWIESGITNDCSITNMVIENGIYVNFNNITGHNLYDAWVRTGYSQLPSATVHIAPPAYEEIGFVTNYNNESGWEDLTYTMSSTVHSDDRRILTNLTSAIYLGRGIKMNSVFFNLAEYAVGLNLVLEYWNGSNWNQISPVTHHLNDGTSNFMTSGQISWDKALIPDWQTNGVSRYSGEDYYWIRIRSSTVPSISPKIKNITPQGKTRFGIMGRAFDDDYAFYVDGFGSSYQIKGYQTDTGTTFEANQLITAGAVNNLLDAFRNFNLYFSTNNNPISVPNKLLTISTVPTWQTTTVLNSGINFVASFISTNMIGSTSIPANTKYSTTYYAAKTTSQEANTLWELIEVGNGFTNILGQSAETPLVQTTPTIISTSISTKSNMTVSSTGYLGVRIYGIRYGNAASMNLYGGGNYGSSLVLPTLGGAPLSITEAPIDDIAYGRKNQSWTQVLEPDGSGVGLSGIVKETDPKYINTLTNEQDLAALRTYHYGSQDIIESQTNWFQTDNDGTITNFIYQTGRENVVIPWMIDGKEIIKIGDHAFLLKPIETITAPKTIKYIGETAFLLCTNLVSISFPAVEIITNQAFSNCRNLTNIILPNAYYFDNNVFSQCTNLQYANLPNATIFKNYVFYNCLKLHTVILPKIEEISEGALENCNNLTSIVFSSNAPVVSSLTSIFENTSSNLICTVNNSFATGWDDTFQGKRVVRLPVYADTAIIDNIFIGNTIQDTKLNIFTDGTNIYQTDVINHTNKISTDSSVTNISQHLIISAGTIYERPDLVPSPESWFTFDGTNTITGYVGPTVNSDNIVIPYQINGKPITKIGSYSFAHNYISHDVTGIIYMPNIITDIDDEAFPGYPNKVYLPSSLKRIGSGAFDESALAIFGDVILPEGLTNIGNYAFEYCTYVKNLTIGKNVKYIGNFQFGGFGYHAPVNIYWYGDKPEVGEQIFTTCPPNSVTNIIMNPQASGWDSTFEGMPVIRYPLYADKLYSISGDLYLQGSNYGSRIINSILNWDIAFEWGNHAQAGYSTHEDSTNAATAVLSTRTITIDEMTGSLSSNLIFNTGYESRISALENAPESGGTIASVYSPISNVATGTTVSVTVSSTQQIYSVVTDSRILLFTNNLSSVVFSGTSNISWDVWIDFRTWLSIGGEEAWAADSRPYVVPSVGWANNIRWADGDVPEISTTGRYHFAFSTVDGSRVNGRQIYPTAQKWQRLVFQYALAATYADGWAYAQWNNPEITNYAKLFDSLPASQYKILKFAFWRWANAAQSKYAVAYQNDGQITPTYSTNTVIWSEAFGYRALGYYPQWRSMWHRDPQMVGTHITGEEINLRGNFVLWYLGYAEAAAMNRIYFYENAERPMNELEREQYDAGVRLPAGR